MVAKGAIISVSLVSTDNNKTIKLANGKTMLGRDWLGISDKRLSRKQVTILIMIVVDVL
jgi:hypothetical protein